MERPEVSSSESPILLTTGQAAKLLGVCTRTVIRWIDSGYAKGIRLPDSTHRRISVEEVEKLQRIMNRSN